MMFFQEFFQKLADALQAEKNFKFVYFLLKR